MGSPIKKPHQRWCGFFMGVNLYEDWATQTAATATHQAYEAYETAWPLLPDRLHNTARCTRQGIGQGGIELLGVNRFG